MYAQYVSLKLVCKKKVKYDRVLLVPEACCQIASEILIDADKEKVLAFYLDGGRKINAINLVSIGTANKCMIHPREVFKPAILCNAVSVILAHNHPGGDSKPGKNDYDSTRMLIRAGRIVGIEILDHIIIGMNRYGEICYWSMRERDPWLFNLENALAVEYDGELLPWIGWLPKRRHPHPSVRARQSEGQPRGGCTIYHVAPFF